MVLASLNARPKSCSMYGDAEKNESKKRLLFELVFWILSFYITIHFFYFPLTSASWLFAIVCLFSNFAILNNSFFLRFAFIRLLISHV